MPEKFIYCSFRYSAEFFDGAYSGHYVLLTIDGHCEGMVIEELTTAWRNSFLRGGKTFFSGASPLNLRRDICLSTGMM